MAETKTHKKIHKVMAEFSEGDLHSGSSDGPVVTNRKQAIAIAMSEAGKSKKKRRTKTRGSIPGVTKRR